jgi:restriction endonuclease S subunit
MKFEKLGNIVTIKKGKKPSFSENPNENSVRVIQIDDLRNDNNIKYTDDKTGVLANEEDVLLAWDGANAGTIGFGKQGYIGSTIALLRKNNPDKFSTIFIGKFLQSKFDYLRSKATGATIPHIDGKTLRELEIPVISLTEQKHIAEVLSKAEALIAERKQSIQLLDEYLKSTFLEMFGDPDKNPNNFQFTELEKMCSVIVDCPHSTPLKSKNTTNFPCIRTSELTNGNISWETMQYLDEDEYIKRTQRLIPEAGDIVYGREGTYGDAVILPAGYKFSLGQRTMLFRPDFKKTNSIFLLAMVRSDFVYRQAKRKNSGSTVGHVNVKDIKQFKIYCPPLTLQTQFAVIVEKMEALKAQYKEHLQSLEQMYGALSQRAFRGEQTPIVKTKVQA